jgi:hypothetical protein
VRRIFSPPSAVGRGRYLRRPPITSPTKRAPAPFAGWDVAGAKQFGYPTFWVNRLQSPAEELGVQPADGMGRSLPDLIPFLDRAAGR